LHLIEKIFIIISSLISIPFHQVKKELEHHVYSVMADDLKETHPSLPTSYLQHLVVSNFIETLTWWLKKGQDFTDQEVVQFYLDLLIPKN